MITCVLSLRFYLPYFMNIGAGEIQL